MKSPETNRPGPEPDARPVVFVVDDEPMLLDLTTAILEPAGFRVRVFRDAELALEAYRSAARPPALIITDYAMHAMSGMDFIRECRRLDAKQKILLVSGTVDEGIYYNSPVRPDQFLAKPYQADQLARVVWALVTSPAAPRKKSQ